MKTITTPSQDEAQEHIVVKTTLYDLIEAVNAAVQPGEESLVILTVMHLLDTSHVTFSHKPVYYN